MAALIAVGFLVDGAANAIAATPVATNKTLLVSAKANHSNAYVLSRVKVRGLVYIFLGNAPGQESQVLYYLDDPNRQKAPVSVSPINTSRLSNGRHSIVAVETLKSGKKQVFSSYFTIANQPAATIPSKQFLPPSASGKKWSLTFSEEFNGTGYDSKKLTPCFDWNYGDCTKTFNQGREVYRPSQIRVSGGTAKLVAEPMSPAVSDAGCFQSKCDYKSGLLSTARPNASNGSDYLYKFTYGYVESRMKISSTSGFFTAFWMLPADSSYSYDYEIDILEQLGFDPTQMFMTYHYGGREQSFTKNSNPTKNGACADKNYGTGFHNFGLDWQPTHIAWYIDGVKCQEFTDAKNIVNVPMQIIIDMMVDNQWERDWGKTVQGSATKSQLELDYLRVYQQK